MHLITRQDLANRAAQRFEERYGVLGHWTLSNGRMPSEILTQLKALGPTPDPDQVDAIIGNTSWTAVPRCDECGATDQPYVAQVGEKPDYESNTAHLCPGCIHQLAKLVISTIQ